MFGEYLPKFVGRERNDQGSGASKPVKIFIQ